MKKLAVWPVLFVVISLCVGCATPTPVAPTVAPQPTEAAPTEASPTERVVTHFSGETTIPAEPQRIVALGEDWLLADLLALGVKPIASTVNVAESVPGIEAAELDGIQLYTSFTFELETLTALQPDLIIAYAYLLDTVSYDILSQIAPTVVVDGSDALKAYVATAEIFGQGDKAGADVEAFHARVQEERANLPGGDISAATIYPGPSLAIWVDGPIAAPQLLLDLGYTLQPNSTDIPDASNGRAFVGLESLPSLDADKLILLQSSGVEGEDEAVAAIQADPLWAQLPAVKGEQVHTLDRLGYPGFRGWVRLLDDLLAILQTEPVTYTIQHSMGETVISGVPQRIVALEWTYVEDLLALGIQPIGVADIEGYNDWVKIPIGLSPEAVDVGTRGEPNLETLVGLKPDLIITVAFRSTENYDELSAIAPTLVFDPYPTDESLTQYDEMRQTFLTIADVVNREAEGEAVLEKMEGKFAEAKATLEEGGLAGEKFVLSQAWSYEGNIGLRLFTANGMATQIVEQIGLVNGWEGGFQQYGFSDATIETLPTLGDLHFFYVLQGDDPLLSLETVKPVWDNLEFVKNGHAYPLGGDTWLFGGPLSAEAVVDIVVSALTQAES